MLNTFEVDPFRHINSDYLTKCFIDLNAVVQWTVEQLKPEAHRFEGIVVRGVSGMMVGPMTASLLKKPWCVIRKPGEGTHSDHKTVEGWHGFKTYIIIIDDLTATGGTIRTIQGSLRRHAEDNRQDWEILPECVGFYLYNHQELVWRGDGVNYNYHDKLFLFKEIPARPTVSEQISAAAYAGQRLLADRA